MLACSCLAAASQCWACVTARVAFRRPEPGTNLDLRRAAIINDLRTTKIQLANWTPQVKCNQRLIRSKQATSSKPGADPRWCPDACLQLFGCLSLCAYVKHVCKPEWPFAGRSLEPIWTWDGQPPLTPYEQTLLHRKTRFRNTMQPTLNYQKTSNEQQTRDLSKMVPWCLLAAVWLLKPMWNMSASQGGLLQAGAWNQPGLDVRSHLTTH